VAHVFRDVGGRCVVLLGPANRVPEIIRIPALLPIPVLVPIAVMFYWQWRMRGRKSVRGIVTASPIATERTIEVMS
jgi:hypothetical protein